MAAFNVANAIGAAGAAISLAAGGGILSFVWVALAFSLTGLALLHFMLRPLGLTRGQYQPSENPRPAAVEGQDNAAWRVKWLLVGSPWPAAPASTGNFGLGTGYCTRNEAQARSRSLWDRFRHAAMRRRTTGVRTLLPFAAGQRTANA